MNTEAVRLTAALAMRTRRCLCLKTAGILLTALSIGATSPALGQGCDSRPQQSQFALENLRRAGSEADLATAQDFADRARRELEQLASAAARCGCKPAQSLFDAAESQIRQARDAESRRDLRDIVGRTVPMLDQAMAALRSCIAR